MRPAISVIIVSWNTRDVLRDCLRSIFTERGSITREVIVSDNDSRDGTAEMIQAEFPEVIVIANAQNLGFAGGNNVAIGRARGDYLLLLNPDTILHPGALQGSLEFAERHPRAAVVGCRTLNADGSIQRNCFLPPDLLNIAISSLGLHRLFPRSRFFGRERMTYWDLDREREVAVVAGCFMLCRHDAVTEVGLLDEHFFMYAEEVDWCVRFKRHGWQIWYTHHATITHFGGVSASKAPMLMREQEQRSLVVFLRKYHSYIYVVMCRIILMAGFLLRALMQAGKVARLKTPNLYRAGVARYLQMIAFHLRGC